MDINYNNIIATTLFGVNLKNTGSTKIMTTENGNRNLYLFAAHFESSAASSIVTPATACIGTNSTSYNNILFATALTGLTGTGIHLPVSFNATSSVVPPNTDVFVNVTIASVGTSQTGNVILIGYYK